MRTRRKREKVDNLLALQSLESRCSRSVDLQGFYGCHNRGSVNSSRFAKFGGFAGRRHIRHAQMLDHRMVGAGFHEHGIDCIGESALSFAVPLISLMIVTRHQEKQVGNIIGSVAVEITGFEIVGRGREGQHYGKGGHLGTDTGQNDPAATTT